MVETPETAKVRSLTSEQEERVSFILYRAKRMKMAKIRYSGKWDTYERIWKLVLEERTGADEWRANLPDTWAYATIKTAQSAFTDSRVVPRIKRHEDEDQGKAQDITDLYVDIAEKGSMDRELYYVRLDAFRLGIGFTKTVYVEDKREVHEIERFDPEKNEITYKKGEVKDFDDPKTIRVSPKLMLVDEMANADWNSARDCIELEILHYDTAKQKYSHLIGKDAWDKNISKTSSIREYYDQISRIAVSATASTLTTSTPAIETKEFFAPIDVAEDLVEIIHYWNKIEDCYEILANGYPLQLRTKKDPSPIPYLHKQLPYTPVPYSPYSGDEFWPAGIIEIGLAEIRAIREFREMMNDRQRVSLFRPAFGDPGVEMDKRNLKLRPFSYIPVRGGNVKLLDIPGISNADIQLLKGHEESYKRITGIDERILGISPEEIRLTATEVSYLREAAMRRLREFSFLYKDSLRREVLLKISLFKQYYVSPVKKEPRLKRDKGAKEVISALKEFRVKTGTNVYRKKRVYEGMFDGDIDVDIDMQFLIPTTPAQEISKWGQVIRDVLPVAQQLGISLKKLYDQYLSALDVSLENLLEDPVSASLMVAEAEHQFLIEENTSANTLRALPNGTPDHLLTWEHIQRHRELLKNEENVGISELQNLARHIAQDEENYLRKSQQPKPKADLSQAMASPLMGQVGGVSQFPPNRAAKQYAMPEAPSPIAL